jgi:hypothetical protein
MRRIGIVLFLLVEAAQAAARFDHEWAVSFCAWQCFENAGLPK